MKSKRHGLRLAIVELQRKFDKRSIFFLPIERQNVQIPVGNDSFRVQRDLDRVTVGVEIPHKQCLFQSRISNAPRRAEVL